MSFPPQDILPESGNEKQEERTNLSHARRLKVQGEHR